MTVADSVRVTRHSRLMYWIFVLKSMTRLLAMIGRRSQYGIGRPLSQVLTYAMDLVDLEPADG